MTQDEIRNNFSSNLIRLRKANGLTQLALAEKLNYSDKAVSKWEVGSVLPDVETMSHIADFFGITVNDLIYPERKLHKVFPHNHVVITSLSVCLAWFLATVVYLILQQSTDLPRIWLTFTVTATVSMIILVVFSAIWFNKIITTLAVSGLFWSTIINIYLFVNSSSLWFIFIIGIVGQLMILFWSQLKKIRIPKRRKKTK
ncbi:MAG: helix-turn-helix transcriptional regulator [Clostridiales bacterium]|nr:helix-turn-helix transcriptional regulator [Clostridiales bacterium]